MGKSSDGLLLPIVKAGLIHIILFGLLFVSFHPNMKQIQSELKANPAHIIRATAISSETVEKLVEKKQQKKNAAAQAERDRKNRIREAAEKKKKAAQDKKRKKSDRDKKRKADAEKKRKTDAEIKRKADAEKKRKADAEIKRKADAELKRKAELQAQLNAKKAAARGRQVLSEAQKYLALVKQKVYRNWIKPNQSGICLLKIRLGPGGIVISVNDVSGLQEICRAAKAAVYKAEPLPVSSDPEVFKKMRIFELEFDPQEN